jgi:hypothetical protein
MGGEKERMHGKETLIKAVIQAMPTYNMSCFQLAKGTCQKLVSMSAQFRWSGALDKRSMHWLSWDKIACYNSHDIDHEKYEGEPQ